MVKKRGAAVLPNNIILLQNLVRRDPESYREEFLQQYAHYESLRDLFMSNPSGSQNGAEFAELIGFVSAVCGCFSKETKQFPDELKALITNNHRDLSPELREKIIQCLVMLRNKDVITAESLIQTIFPLLAAYSGTSNLNTHHSKALRRQVYTTLISLLKAVNTGAKNQKLNRSTQALLFNLLEQKDAQGLWATKLTRELWRRGIWDDSRTVEIMTQATLHPDSKVAISGVKFFLGADKEREENFEDDSDEEGFDLSALKHQMTINKKSGKRAKKLEKVIKQMNTKKPKHSATYLNFSAIHLLRDPQGFAEQLFESHLQGKSSNKFDLEQKIALMNLISRLIGTHKLTVLGIYSFFLKYLTPKQRDVTQIMAAAAQASHDLVPPETISVVIRKVADEFVSDGVAPEVAAAGINTIREILSRNPLAIDETLLQDLTEYKGSKSKPVNIAAKSLISLYREVAPEMLKRKDRGKTATMELSAGERTSLQYGVESGVSGIPGIELLAKWREDQGLGANDDEDDDANWEVDDEEVNDSDIEGDWVTVDCDKEYDVEFSDDEDDKKDKEDKEDNESDSDLDLSDDEEMKDEESETPAVKLDADAAFRDLASTRILTPADFAKIEELKVQAGLDKLTGKNRNEDEVDSAKLVGPVKYKQLREERIAQAREGRDEREKFGSRKGKRENELSTTNREKARKKNFVMMIHKRDVQGKAKRSLRDKQKVLRAHITKQKKKGF